jgi:hypothetical protein
MSWLRALDSELRLLGMRGRDRERIVLELADHIDCDPGSEERLGDPGALAAAFVDELASAKSRRAAFDVLAALAATAVVLAVSLRILGQAGYPGFNGPLGRVLVWPALFGVLIAPQVALVCGTLAALRAFRCRGAAVLPAAEVALITRRASLGLAAPPPPRRRPSSPWAIQPVALSVALCSDRSLSRHCSSWQHCQSTQCRPCGHTARGRRIPTTSS